MTAEIPIEIFDQHVAFLAKTGAGKTYAAKGVVERLLDRKRRVCVIDPAGVWWGLRLAADGKSKGYPVIVCGGEFGDVAISEDMAKPLAAAIARSDTPVVVDLSEFSDAATQRFMTAFLAQLRHDNTAPLHLVIDEADMFAPQKPMRDQNRMLHQMNHIVRRGRIKGFRAILITQRPAVIHKDVLTQVNALVAMRMLSPQDRNAIKAWIEYQADAARAKEILSSLASLPRGTGWVWAPEQNMLSLISFPPIKTYDSSSAPKHDGKPGKISLGSIDIEALRAGLEKAGIEIKQNDPAALRAKIAELERKLRLASGAGNADAEREGKIQQAAWQDGFDTANKQWREHLVAPIGSAKNIFEAVQNHQMLLLSLRAPVAATPPAAKHSSIGSEIASKPAPHIKKPNTQAAPDLDLKLNCEITGPQRTLLGALAWWESFGADQPTRPMAAFIAGWSPNSGHVSNVLGTCRTQGLVDYPAGGRVCLTDAGRKIAPPPDLTVPFINRIRAVLSGPQYAVVEALLANGAMSRGVLAERLNWSANSGHISNVLGSLRTLTIITYPDRGSADLAPWVREQAANG